MLKLLSDKDIEKILAKHGIEVGFGILDGPEDDPILWPNWKFQPTFIINYDTSTHWMAVYVDMDTHDSYFFDSIGLPPDARIIEFYKDYVRTMRVVNDEDIQGRNKREDSVACGWYACAFLIWCMALKQEPLAFYYLWTLNPSIRNVRVLEAFFT